MPIWVGQSRRRWRVRELLGVDLATVRELAVGVEPYVRADDPNGMEPDAAGAAAPA
jgi:hypothetical protein